MQFIKNIKRQMLLNKIQKLEHQAQFISPFFCGETMYPIERAKNQKALAKAKKQLKYLEQKHA